MNSPAFDVESFQEEVFSALDDLQPSEKATPLNGAFLIGGGAAGATIIASILHGSMIERVLAGASIAGLLVILVAARRYRQRSSEPPTSKRPARPKKTPAHVNERGNIPRTVKDAEAMLKNPTIREILCPALHSGLKDTYDIAKRVTPILIPFALAGTIAIPLNPVLFAVISIVIARMGAASLCRGLTLPKDPESKDE